MDENKNIRPSTQHLLQIGTRQFSLSRLPFSDTSSYPSHHRLIVILLAVEPLIFCDWSRKLTEY